jgi:hypothetical protein
MTSRDYYRSFLQLMTTTTVVTSHWIECDEQDIYAAYLKGSLNLVDGSKLFFAQYVRIEGPGRDRISREKYRYRWQAPTGETRYRWDNARHRAELATSQTMYMLDRTRRRGRAVRQISGESWV